jgi:hypothetical protein
MTEENFDVWLWFPHDLHDRIGNALSAEQAVKLAYGFSERPAAKIGIIQRITIVNPVDDTTCFEWKYGQGVTFS